MKKMILFLVFFQLHLAVSGQGFKQKIVTTDIDNFWVAYDKITSTKDTVLQQEYINSLYINKGTDGLKGLIQVRRYSAREFVTMINRYPRYWKSIRSNTLSARNEFAQIEKNILKLKEYYPEMKPATVYFSVGAFRSGGTYLNNRVLLGGEFIFAGQNAETSELPERLQKVIKDYSPYDIPLLITHEYVHTQQKEWDYNILTRCVAEGVAEFISTLIAAKPLSPPVKFGKENPKPVLDKFMEDLFIDNNVDDWMWNTNRNALKVNDLGYYIGYEICERYYQQARDKKQAVRDLINLDYANDSEFSRVVDASGFLPLTVEQISLKYEAQKPTILEIKELTNGSTEVNPDLSRLTIQFSSPMDECCRSFDFGELGEDHALRIEKVIGWSDDKTAFLVEIRKLKPDWQYQLLVSNFRNLNGTRMKPYLIAFKTK